MPDVQWLEGGITAVPGILASGIAAGIKPSGKKDLALIYSSSPARATAVFTTNQIKGAPVLVSQEHVRDGRAQAILASAGELLSRGRASETKANRDAGRTRGRVVVRTG